jgi:hypothetical protein
MLTPAAGAGCRAPAGSDDVRSDSAAKADGSSLLGRLWDEIVRTHVRLRLVIEQLAEIEEQ